MNEDKLIGLKVVSIITNFGGSLVINHHNNVWTVTSLTQSNGFETHQNEKLLEALSDLEWDLEFANCNCDPSTGEPPEGVKSSHAK